MTLNLAILIIVFLVTVFFLFVEVFTVLFMMTGMTERKARFQVISMLTATGFTTSESEVIVSSRRRRRLATITILFGYIFAVSIVSMLINAMITYEKSGNQSPIATGVIIISFIVLLLVIKRIPFLRDRFDNLIKVAGARFMFSASSNPLLVLDYYGERAIVEIRITEVPEPFVDKTLMESGMQANFGLQIFVIKRANETKHVVGPNDMLLPGDRVVMFGTLSTIHELFSMQPSFEKHAEGGAVR